MAQNDQNLPPNSPAPGRGNNPASGGRDKPVDPSDRMGGLEARFDQLRKEVDAQENADQTRKSAEEARQKVEGAKQDAEKQNEEKRLARIGDGTSWSGPSKIFDNLWGKWFWKGQPVKVAKYENQFGDNISNLSLGTEQLNVFGSQVDMVVNPFLWIKFSILGAKFAGGKAFNAYQRKWGDPTSRPSVPGGVFTGVGVAMGALGVGLPFLLGAGGRTLIQVSDNTDMTYFGTSVDVKRHVDSFEITLQKNAKTHYLAVAALMAGVIFIGLANLIVRLAWYNFEPELADKSVNFDPAQGEGSKGKEKDSDTKNPSGEPAKTENSGETLSEEWEDRWKFPKLFARTLVPLFETRWVGILILLENSLARQLEWAEWRLKAMKQKLDMARWDLRQLQFRIGVQSLPFALEGTDELDGLQAESAELEGRVAQLEANLAQRQAKVDELTTDLKAGEPE